MKKYILPLLFFCISVVHASDDAVFLGDNVNNVFVQHTLKHTDRNWDLAIRGSGFFPLEDSKTGEMFYTRLGAFEMDRDGYIILKGHPNLRLVVESESHNEPLNMLRWKHLGGFEMAGLSWWDEGRNIGNLQAIYRNGETQSIARIVFAKFFNNSKLVLVAPYIYKADAAALPMYLAPPTEKGMGGLESKALEMLDEQ